MSLAPSNGPSGPRLSDRDRERVIEVLKRSCGDGRLTLDEFSTRVESTYRAVSLRDLPPVLADLPHPFGSDLAGVLEGGTDQLPVSVDAPAPDPEGGGRKATRWTVSVMGGSQRRGRWRLREKTNAVAVMGGCRLDMRSAAVEGRSIVINAVAFMGGIDIVVPEGIEVELGGIAIMGGKDARRLKDVPPIPGSPVIRVRAFAFWGSVTVRSKPAHVEPSGLTPGDRPTRPPLGSAQGQTEAADATGATGASGATGAGQAQDATYGSSATRLVDALADGPGPTGDDLDMDGFPQGTVTIMFSDIEGFTSLTERLGDRRAMDVLREHNRIIRGRIGSSGGHEIKAQGDGFMIAFSGASRALHCAVGIQSDFADRNLAEPDVPIQVRLGLHSGEAVRDGHDFMGGAVILAARITQQAHGGEILVSSVLKELCDLSGEFQFTDGRDVHLKGLSESRRVYSVQVAADEDGRADS